MKILFIAMVDSVHTARWIDQISDQGWDIHIIPSLNYKNIHSLLKNVTVHNVVRSHQKNINSSVKIKGFPVYFYYLASLFRRRIFRAMDPEYDILHMKKIIEEIKPDIIHSMEFQAGAYPILKVKRIFDKEFPIWITTNWGSDIYYFQNMEEHKEKIKEVLSSCDYYSYECERDLELARKLGLKGKELPVNPNGGGFELNKIKEIRSIPPSKRKIILLKGYQSWSGRALTGLNAICLFSKELEDYEIFVHTASPVIKKKLKEFLTTQN